MGSATFSIFSTSFVAVCGCAACCGAHRGPACGPSRGTSCCLRPPASGTGMDCGPPALFLGAPRGADWASAVSGGSIGRGYQPNEGRMKQPPLLITRHITAAPHTLLDPTALDPHAYTLGPAITAHGLVLTSCTLAPPQPTSPVVKEVAASPSACLRPSPGCRLQPTTLSR